MSKVRVELPPKLIPVFSGPARYRGAYGGRGSAKTRSFALMTAIRAYMFAEAGISGVILCAREFVNNLEGSSLSEVRRAIRSTPWLNAYFELGEHSIRTKNRRVSYVFSGLRHNLSSLRSRARILIAWVDDAETVSEAAWTELIPTVRECDSEIWVTWSPELENSPTDRRFRKYPPPGARIAELNYGDNPWFPEVLEQERQADRRRLDEQTYAWIWGGTYRRNSEAQIFAGKFEVSEFRPGLDWHGPYQGIDWGFSQDPMAASRWWVSGDDLYLEYEAVRTGLELDDTVPFISRRIPGFEMFETWADSARPESISYVRRHGLPYVQAASKGRGSVSEGIAHMRSYGRIIIHPRCITAIEEFQRYRYRVDRLSGDVLDEIVDDYNHVIDSGRYALEPLMKGRYPEPSKLKSLCISK